MSRKKPVLAADLDSVLADIMPPLLAFYNRQFRATFQLEDHTTYDLTRVWGISEREVIDRVYDFYQSNEMNDVKPVSGAIDGITYLAAKYRVIVVTSRPSFLLQSTKNWVLQYFGAMISEVYCTNQLTHEGNQKRLKSEVCRDISAVACLEDSLEFAEDIASIPIPVYLFDMPWNSNVHLNYPIHRLYSWSEIPNFL